MKKPTKQFHARFNFYHSSGDYRNTMQWHIHVVNTAPSEWRIVWCHNTGNEPSEWDTTANPLSVCWLRIPPNPAIAPLPHLSYSLFCFSIMYGRGKSSVLPAWMTSGSDSAVSVVLFRMLWLVEYLGQFFISWWQTSVVHDEGLCQQL